MRTNSKSSFLSVGWYFKTISKSEFLRSFSRILAKITSLEYFMRFHHAWLPYHSLIYICKNQNWFRVDQRWSPLFSADNSMFHSLENQRFPCLFFIAWQCMNHQWPEHGRTTCSESMQTIFLRGIHSLKWGVWILKNPSQFETKPINKQAPRRKETLKLTKHFYGQKKLQIKTTYRNNVPKLGQKCREVNQSWRLEYGSGICRSCLLMTIRAPPH